MSFTKPISNQYFLCLMHGCTQTRSIVKSLACYFYSQLNCITDTWAERRKSNLNSKSIYYVSKWTYT